MEPFVRTPFLPSRKGDIFFVSVLRHEVFNFRRRQKAFWRARGGALESKTLNPNGLGFRVNPCKTLVYWSDDDSVNSDPARWLKKLNLILEDSWDLATT